MDKISASHILIMHKGSQSSRSDLSKKEALDLINDIYEKLNKNKKKYIEKVVGIERKNENVLNRYLNFYNNIV